MKRIQEELQNEAKDELLEDWNEKIRMFFYFFKRALFFLFIFFF